MFPALAAKDPSAVALVGDQHGRLEPAFDVLTERFESLLVSPDPAAGLDLYRDLVLWIAEYLEHIHEEETTVMGRLWEVCTDDELAAVRAAFMADTPPEVMETALELMLPAVDEPTRIGMITGMAASAPPHVVQGVLAIAARVLPAEAAARLRSAAVQEAAAIAS